MDLQKYEEALDNISELIISKYYNNNYSKYIKAKSVVIERFNNTEHENVFTSTPLFLPYFRKHFFYYCQNAPDFVGKVLYSFSNIPISDIKYVIKVTAKQVFFIESKKKLTNVDNAYKDIRKKIDKIIDSPNISKNAIKEVLNLLESLAEVIYYRKARFIYGRLFKELRFSLQLLSHVENLEKIFFPNRNLIDAYPDLLLTLGNLTKIEYSKFAIIPMVLGDLNIIYKKIEESHPIPKIQDRVSDSGAIETKPTDIDKAFGLLDHIEGLSWDEITITLISFESIRIAARDFKQTYHFSELDMKDRRSSEKADSNWILLSLFAKKNGTVTYTDIDSTQKYSSPKKAVATLQNKLKQLIGLKDNPIDKYKRRVGYIAKFYIKNEVPFQFHGSTQQKEKINELKGE